MHKIYLAATFAIAAAIAVTAEHPGEPETTQAWPLHADVVATGIPGAGAIAQIGTFHKGGPLHDNAVLAASTETGQVLERTRLFVASTSNFGAQVARPNESAGSILSLDVSGGPLVVPPDFASSGLQATALGGRVRLFTAQSPAFLNSVHDPAAITAGLPAVSLPLGISFNNGFGRPWFANAPLGSNGDGTITVIDPDGAPLAGAPSTVAGGVFAGTVTNRSPASTHGLSAGALATALVTKSPDQSGRAVFLAALADGSVVQVHVQRGVDGLAPPGSFTPIRHLGTETSESPSAAVVPRTGMLFNWVPTRVVFVADPIADRILVLDLNDDGVLFQASVRYIRSPLLHTPIDIAPAVPEVAARNFASNTTLGGGSDFYVLNRKDNAILRMTQDGRVLAARSIAASVHGFRVSGIAVSEDARTIWVTATAPGRQGVVLQTEAFGSGFVTPTLLAHARRAGANGAVAQGASIFAQELTPPQALGPLFNGRSCEACHNTPFAGGMGVGPETFVTRVARIENGIFDPLTHRGGPIARQHSIAELGAPCGLATGTPREANATSVRSPMTLRGTALIDNIELRDILAVQAAQPESVRGRLNVLADGRPGRFGWKAQTATLVEFMGQALRDEMGLTNPLAPRDQAHGCGASILKPEADAAPLTSLVAFLDTIDPPVPAPACLTSPGAALFESVGCATCHRPSMPGPGGAVRLYSDLLLHDMGPALADGFVQGSATGRDFRTTPLWRLADRLHFLHDGRATSVRNAIDAHGGHATAAAAAFGALSSAERQAMLDFLGCL